MSDASSLPIKAIVAVGTYDGVVAGYDIGGADSKDNKKFQIAFASPVHGGSVRSLAFASKAPTSNSTSNNEDLPGTLVSCGYDEMLQTHDFVKRLTSSGEVRTPADFGTPVASSFAPPPGGEQASSHCLVGFSSGKLVIYKKRDWSIQHVLAGHDGGVAALGVHPSGKMALTGGSSDGKLKLWDLTKGRLTYVNKINPASTSVQGRTHYDPVVTIVWNRNGSVYGLCYGTHATVRHVETGSELLDVDLPSKINQICFIEKEEGIFLAAACNDGSLPVLAVNSPEESGRQREVRAIMAIEPVDGPVAGEERFKCIQSLIDYFVVTANSAGVVSLMNLGGAVQMILQESQDTSSDKEDEIAEKPVHLESDDETDSDKGDNTEDEDLAVEIVDSVRLGTGARITCLTAWCALTTQQQARDEQEKSIAATHHPHKTKVRCVIRLHFQTKTRRRPEPGCYG